MKNNKSKKLKMVLVLLVVLMAVTMMGGCGFGKTLKQTKESVSIELGKGKDFVWNVQDYFDVDEEVAEDIVLDTSNVDVEKLGEYEALFTYGRKEYVVVVKVEDTTAPKVEMAERVFITNNIASVDLNTLVNSVSDVSEYALKLVRFEKADNLRVMDKFALKSLAEKISLPCNREELLKLGAEEIPMEAGIYRSVLEVSDVYGNATYEEIYFVLDTRGAEINEVEDLVHYVSKDKLNEKPELDLSLYKGVDNVDGTLDSKELTLEVTLKDEAKHEWIVKVSYADRAGNSTFDEFLITLKEKAEEKPAHREDKNESSDKQEEDKNNSSGDKNNTTTDKNKGESQAEDKDNSSNDKNDTATDKNDKNNSTEDKKPSENKKPSDDKESSSDKEQSSNKKPSSNKNETKYDPADTNKDGWVSAEEGMGYITPEKQACIDAGYGVVCEFDGGEWYAILMKNSEHTINGKHGWEILTEYLADRDLTADTCGGCYINPENGWYWYIAEDIHELITEEDADFWD